MPMFGNSLDSLIGKLDNAIPWMDESTYLGFEVERHDWRPVWELCKEIQAEFRGYKGYASKEARQAAWDRFQQLRTKASRLFEVEKENFASQSQRYKIDILSEARACYWSKSADFFVGAVLGETTVDEMKQLQSRLQVAGRKLSENKSRMTREDKEACFEAIRDSRESHDHFWEKYKDHMRVRREAHEQRQAEFESKRADWINRVKSNIEKNRESLRGAENALDRTRDRISELEAKIADTDSAKWQEIFSGWLEEARAKESDIEDSIGRIRGWIREGEDKLGGA